MSRALAALLMTMGLSLLPTPPAGAATIDLDSCSGTGFDVLALWSAVLTANDESTHPGSDTIRLAPNCLYRIGSPFTGTSYALPPITSAVTILGRGATIRADNADPAQWTGMFDVRSSGDLIVRNVTLENLDGHPAGSYVANAGVVLVMESTLDGLEDTMAGPAVVNQSGASLTLLDSVVKRMRHNSSSGRGGAFHNAGDLYLVSSDLVDNNVQLGPPGLPKYNESVSNTGYLDLYDSRVRVTPNSDATKVLFALGVDNDGTLVLRKSAISGHRYDVPGAGVHNSGTLTGEDSTFSGNLASGTNGRGGAVFNAGTASFLNSVFAGNAAQVSGGDIHNAGTLDVSHVTFNGGGVFNDDASGVATLRASIIASCGGTVGDGGSNLATRSSSGCPGAVGDAKLTSWPFAGVKGIVYALGAGSAAVDAVTGACPATDQRGLARPGGGACDIGAYENHAPTSPTGLVLSQGANPGNTGSIGLDWADASDSDHDDLTYRVYGKDSNDLIETMLASVADSTAPLSALPEGTHGFRVDAFDGNHVSPGSASLSGVVVDLTPPSSPTASPDRVPDFTAQDATAWYGDQVDISFGGSTDPMLTDGSTPSGVATYTAVQSLETSGAHAVSGTATDNAGNTSAATGATFHVDADAPTVSFTACPDNVVLGSAVAVDWTASDAHSGLATAASGVLTVDTSSIGTRTLQASATDNVGHASTATCVVDVIYDFTGFLLPVSNAPALNRAAAGKIVPISFSLAGNQGLDVLATGFPVSDEIPCGTSPLLTSGQPTTSTQPGLVYAGGRYTYSWKTDRAWGKTCRQFVVLLDDGTYHRANFSFR